MVREGRHETRRRKKRAKLNVELQVDDDALSYSSADSVTLPEEDWLRENNARCRIGYQGKPPPCLLVAYVIFAANIIYRSREVSCRTPIILCPFLITF